ncbi:HlyC/CorC family transporter [Candidatus Peregrinibacteria bacterium CG_4_10_14_0_2_um_filter_38_24]|nr:MAG: HlyC/CorC family transporter [Candidatus Peregrinibacteria bacterium CG_4_10_14_0_2_um_filter_38_24]PJC39036.1 MAG: HlyC/CorC family transporter [Candidatus Peregrinibacteria bacterium CG_4_9_14_0_2_um_filter_38_9]
MKIVVIIILTLFNGFFSLAEIAILSVKRHRMEQMAVKGNKRAQMVLELLKYPESFLSSVQVGITLVGIIAGAYGGATLTHDLVPYVEKIELFAPYAYGVSFAIIVTLITYFSIVFGELIPKTIALNYSEQIALLMAPFVKSFSSLSYPFVKVLSFSTTLILKVLSIRNKKLDDLTEEELKYLLKTAGKQGVLEKDETQMHQNIFFFSDQKAKNLQTNASDIEWIDVNEKIENIEKKIKDSPYSKFPVCDGDLDKIKGIITSEDFFERRNQKRFSLKRILSEPIFVPENMNAFDILKLFKKHKQYIGIVMDEFGEVEGIITLHDLTEAIVGELPEVQNEIDPDIVMRDDYSFFVDGGIQIHHLNKSLGAQVINEKSRDYLTLAGFILHHLKRVPKEGEKFVNNGFELEIIDLDGRRIDKVLVKKI